MQGKIQLWIFWSIVAWQWNESHVVLMEKKEKIIMARLKTIYKDGRITVKRKIKKEDELNLREIEIFNNKLIRGLMRPNIDKKHYIVYTAPSGIKLAKYISNGIEKNEFFLIITQTVEMIKKIERNNFEINNVVLELENVNIFSFMYEIIQNSALKIEADTEYANNLYKYLKSKPIFSVIDIENYILGVYPKVYNQIIREKPGQSQNLKQREWEQSSSLKNDMEDGTMILQENMNHSEVDDDGTALLDNNIGQGLETELLNEGTELLEETALLQETKEYPYLIRMFNYEHIDINKPVFRIGKEKSYVDYFVLNNNKVSRIHADIISENNQIYIKDDNSTNGTFVNGELVERNVKHKLSDRDIIRLANEEFEFHIK